MTSRPRARWRTAMLRLGLSLPALRWIAIALPIAFLIAVDVLRLPIAASSEMADDPDAERERLEREMIAVRSPFGAAEAFNIEEIIDPRDTRPLLGE